MWSLLCLCCSCKVKWSAWKPIRIGRQRTCSKSLLHIKVIYDVAVEARLIPLSLNCRCQALWWAIISPECLNLFHWAAAAVLADVYLRHRNVTVGAKLASKKWYKHSKWISEFVSFGACDRRTDDDCSLCMCVRQTGTSGGSIHPRSFPNFPFFSCRPELGSYEFLAIHFLCARSVRCWRKRMVVVEEKAGREGGWGQKLSVPKCGHFIGIFLNGEHGSGFPSTTTRGK